MSGGTDAERPPTPAIDDDAALAAASDDKPRKRSLTLSGHRTSVTLEAAFWTRLRAIAAARGLSINALAARVDAARDPEMPLAGALRVYVLESVAAPAQAHPFKPRPGDARPGDARPGDARPGNARPDDTRPGRAAQPSVASTGNVSSSQ